MLEESNDSHTEVIGSILGSTNFCKLQVVESRRDGRLEVVDHHEYVKSSTQWIKKRPEKHPAVVVGARVCMDAYDQLGVKRPQLKKVTGTIIRS